MTLFFYVVDVAILLNKIKSQENLIFCNICYLYIKYLCKSYGTNIKVLFYGYGNDNDIIKVLQRSRRYIGNDSTVHYFFDKDVNFKMTKEIFLVILKNRRKCIIALFKKINLKF